MGEEERSGAPAPLFHPDAHRSPRATAMGRCLRSGVGPGTPTGGRPRPPPNGIASGCEARRADRTMEIMIDGVPPLSRALQQLLSSETAGSAAVSFVAGLLSVPPSPAR